MAVGPPSRTAENPRPFVLKKIAVFTSTRSEYGLLLPLLRRLSADSRFDLDLLVGGSHLLATYGQTIDRIKEDGFVIGALMPFLSERPGPHAEATALSTLSGLLGEHLYRSQPDLLILLGDRYELLAVASVALVGGIPVAHISGGDVTEGSIDNQVRHALTKLSHLHFPATEAYKRNLIAMGEEEWRICVSGEPGLDEILTIDLMTKAEVFAELAVPIDREIAIATFHPETIGNAISPDFISTLIDRLLTRTPYHLLFTGANFDPGGDAINAALENASRNPRVTFVPSLGQKRYYSAIKYAAIMIGNSSSGLTEAHSFGLPVLNVGNRQLGRLANANVIHVPLDADAVVKAIPAALSPAFRTAFSSTGNIYGDGKAVDRILAFLTQSTPERLLMKRSVFPT